MLSIHSDTLTLIQATLTHLEEFKETSGFLASFEDCDYFRKRYTPNTLNKTKPTLPVPPAVQNPPPLLKAALAEKPIITPSTSKVLPQQQTVEATANSQKIEKPLSASPSSKPSSQHAASKSSKSSPLPLDLPQPAAPENFDDLRKIWNKITAGAPVFEEIPNDEIAKKIASRWKAKNVTAEISILAYQEPASQKALLEQIAKAINILLGPARIVQAEPIEKEKRWEDFLSVPHLKLTIACDYTLWQLGGLMQHYREVPSQGTRHLGSVPIFLLPDLSLYLKDPLLKRSLWKALCQTLS